ncbi:hypothetical protein J3R30DRAFT_3402361 [Lentinula aciculospora]|uniref:FAD/NAD(P)-binding domain-containing protein n=1 Tax=Lentinula aciculospora TaxID=153920 RepID=A0A9W9DS78_9AGAR|nr:hypothetical protein J3R30DRAFT_3402361 [Lentinula aciculospora]
MTIEQLHRFTQLRATDPKLTDSMLLNSNNPSKFSTKPDVVVAGAGIIGLCYAIHLKNIAPQLNIAVYEKNRAPDGLQFYCIDREGVEVTSEDIGGLDLSFQLDRRMSELFLTVWAQSIGINVYHGVEAEFQIAEKYQVSESQEDTHCVKTPQVKLKNFPKPGGTDVNAKLVCDASGFSRKLTSKFGKKELFEGWNCDAYWAYFKEKEGGKAESRSDHWDYPATKHAQSGVPAHEIPSTKALSEKFGCPFEFITSIGWAVRDNHKLPDNLDEYGSGEGERKFNYFKRRYPTLNKLMNGVYELLPRYYGKQTYFVRKSMAYRNPIVAGDGWFAIGNSAGFTNPLISPGINAGIGTAVLAANLSKEILDQSPEQSRAVMQKCAATYQSYSHEFMIPRLHQMNRYWYNSFRDHRLFEIMVPCFWTLGIDDANSHYVNEFTKEDIYWVVGAGQDQFVNFSGKVLDILEASNELPANDDEIEKGNMKESQEVVALEFGVHHARSGDTIT